MAGGFAFLAFLVQIAIFIYLVMLFTRFVKSVEGIEKSVQRAVDIYYSRGTSPGGGPPA